MRVHYIEGEREGNARLLGVGHAGRGELVDDPVLRRWLLSVVDVRADHQAERVSQHQRHARQRPVKFRRHVLAHERAVGHMHEERRAVLAHRVQTVAYTVQVRGTLHLRLALLLPPSVAEVRWPALALVVVAKPARHVPFSLRLVVEKNVPTRRTPLGEFCPRVLFYR